MRIEKIKVETAIYFLALLLALGLRLYHLGAIPLSDSEAGVALQAFNLSKGGSKEIGSDVMYVTVTSVIFFIFQSSEFTARLLPALAGSFLIFTPLLYKKQLGRKASLFLAFALAMDPLFVVISRQAGGEMLSVTFFVCATGFFLARKPGWAGMFSTLALLSGSNVWTGILLFVILLFADWLRRAVLARNSQDKDFLLWIKQLNFPTWSWKGYIFWLLSSMIVLGTIFLMIPSGLGAALSGFVDSFSGWLQAPQVLTQQITFLILSYEVFVLFFALISLFSLFFLRDRLDFLLMVITGLALLWIAAYPGRQMHDAIWVILPLWAFSVRKIQAFRLNFKEEVVPFFGIIILILISAVFLAVSFAGLFDAVSQAMVGPQVRLIVMIGAMVFIVIAVILVSWGWHWEVAIKGLLAGFGIIIFLFNISSTWHASGIAAQPLSEFTGVGGFKDQGILLKTIDDYSTWNTGMANEMDIVVSGIADNSLRWILRERKAVSYVETLPPEVNASIVITGDLQTLTSPLSYTGQDFILDETVALSEMNLSNWLRWFAKREAPMNRRYLILWLRTDLFPGAEVQPVD